VIGQLETRDKMGLSYWFCS